MKHNVLVIGGGGREHAVCWKLSRSVKVGKIYCIPGNAGISEIAECHPEMKATDIYKILDFVESHPDIYMTVVTPDDPLALGLVNKLNESGFRAFGPSKEAAVIEASKVFSKNLMKKYNIPTARYETFDDYDRAAEYLKSCDFPIVLKADGLALGKGVLIVKSLEEAEIGLKDLMLDKAFGSAGNNVVIEEFLTGFEVSVLCFTDGETIVPMVSSQDHKRALDGDKGLNTGGMGAFSPSVRYTDAMAQKAYETVFIPTLKAMNAEGRKFKGVLYFGLMINGDNIKVLEYNARFGDPETQAILPRLTTDLFDIFDTIIDEKLNTIKIEWKSGACVSVVIASGGYPVSYEKGYPITFKDISPDVLVFHAGTAFNEAGEIVTNGGRVLNVTALSATLGEARDKAYQNVAKISFEKMHFRKDIYNDGGRGFGN